MTEIPYPKALTWYWFAKGDPTTIYQPKKRSMKHHHKDDMFFTVSKLTYKWIKKKNTDHSSAAPSVLSVSLLKTACEDIMSLLRTWSQTGLYKTRQSHPANMTQNLEIMHLKTSGNRFS